MSDRYAWIAGERTNIRVSDDNELLSAVEIGGLIIEAPQVNTESDSFNSQSINAATTTTLTFANNTTGYTYAFHNKGSVDLSFNHGKGAITVIPGQVWAEDMIKFTTFTVVNALTTTGTFTAKLSGV